MKQTHTPFKKQRGWFFVAMTFAAFVLPIGIKAQTNPTDLILTVRTDHPVLTVASANGKTIVVTAINTTATSLSGQTIVIDAAAGLSIAAAPAVTTGTATQNGNRWTWTGDFPQGQSTLTFTLTAAVANVDPYNITANVASITGGSTAIAAVKVLECVTLPATPTAIFDIANNTRTLTVTGNATTLSGKYWLSTTTEPIANNVADAAVTAGSVNLMANPINLSAAKAGETYNILFNSISDAGACGATPVCVSKTVEFINIGQTLHPGIDPDPTNPNNPNPGDGDPNTPDEDGNTTAPEDPTNPGHKFTWPAGSTKGIICSGGTLALNEIFAPVQSGDGTMSYTWKITPTGANGVKYNDAAVTTDIIGNSNTDLTGTFTNETTTFKDVTIEVTATYTHGTTSTSSTYNVIRRILPALPVANPTVTITHIACFGATTGAISITEDLSGYNLLWTTTGAANLTAQQNNKNLTNLPAGEYTLTISAGTACPTTTKVITATIRQPRQADAIAGVDPTTKTMEQSVCKNSPITINLPTADGSQGFQVVDNNGEITAIAAGFVLEKESATNWKLTSASVTSDATIYLRPAFDVDGDGTLDNCTPVQASDKANNITVRITAKTPTLTHVAGTGAATQTICEGSEISAMKFIATGADDITIAPTGSLTVSMSGDTAIVSGGATLTEGTIAFSLNANCGGTAYPTALSITVEKAAIISVTGDLAQTICKDNIIQDITFTKSASTTLAITPDPGSIGLTWNGTTLSGTATQSGIFNYTVTPSTTACGNGTPSTITITVEEATMTPSAAEEQTICQGGTITAITYVPGQGTTIDVSPATLPTGITWNNNELTTTAALLAGDYTITLTPIAPQCGAGVPREVKIHVLPANYDVTKAADQTICELKIEEKELFTITTAVPQATNPVNMEVNWTPHTGSDAKLNVQYLVVSDGTTTRFAVIDAANGKATVDIRGMLAGATVKAMLQATGVPANRYEFTGKISGGSCEYTIPTNQKQVLDVTALPTIE